MFAEVESKQNRFAPFWKLFGLLSIAILIGACIGFALNVSFQLHMTLPLAEKLHRFLENAYLCAAILITPLVAVGLYQLWLTREGIELTRNLSQEGQDREALKMAIDQCSYYAEKVVPQSECFRLKITQNIALYRPALLEANLLRPPFTVRNNEIVIPGFNFEQSNRAMVALAPCELLNFLESFAIPFAANMANEDIGYFETGINFIEMMQIYMPSFLAFRQSGRARYRSAVSLYERWQTRYLAENSQLK
jgi:hypothetical protein